ncbi:MAG: hypothetical protein ABW224_20520 [Kibdelosporangium sp.]
MSADDIIAALKPVGSKDINSSHDLVESFRWFRENLPARPGRIGELYQRWNGHPASRMGPRGWAARPWNPEDDRMVDELGGIDFGPMLGDSERFANLRGATEEMRVGAESLRKRLDEAWSGPAADAALARLDMLGKGAIAFRDTLNQFAAALDSARTTVREAIVNVRDAIKDEIKPFDVPDGVDFRRGQIDRINAAMSGQEPYGRPWTPDELRVPATVDLNQGNWGHWWSNESINVLDAVCDNYFNAIGPLRKLIGETTMATTASWNALNDALKRIQAGTDLDPFGKAAPKVAIKVSSPDRVGLTVDGKNYAMNFQQDQTPPAGGGASPAAAGGGGGGGASERAGGPTGAGSGVGTAEAADQRQPGTMTGAQMPSSVDTPDRSGPAPAGMAAGPAGGGGQAGGGMPMGGMGAGGAGGGGGDSERKDSKWRTQGDLFDDAAQLAIPMVIGDDDPYGVYGKERT